MNRRPPLSPAALARHMYIRHTILRRGQHDPSLSCCAQQIYPTNGIASPSLPIFNILIYVLIIKILRQSCPTNYKFSPPPSIFS